jgi:hypothetical protein
MKIELTGACAKLSHVGVYDTGFKPAGVAETKVWHILCPSFIDVES